VSSKLRKFYGIFINSIFVEIAARCSAKRENTVYWSSSYRYLVQLLLLSISIFII